MFWIALITLVLIAVLNVVAYFGLRTIKHIADIEPLNSGPKVSVIIAAKDEQELIGGVIEQLKNQSYNNIEIIVVNDRSTDKTGEIIDAAGIKTVHIDKLPDGWIGKNHACYQGTKQADGDYILFMDAGTRLDYTAIARAIRHMNEGGFDFITAIFGPKNTGQMLKTIIFDITLEGIKTGFAWKCRDRSSNISVAAGAFNLFTREIYNKSKGYERIPMCAVDDQMVAVITKRENAKADFVWGEGIIDVDWYKTIPGFIGGIRKHAFTGMQFSLLAALIYTLLLFMLYIFPFIAVFITQGITQVLFAVVLLIRLIMFQWAATVAGTQIKSPLWVFLSAPVGLIALWNSAYRILRLGGIEWAGKVYPLDELKTCFKVLKK